MTPGHDTYRDHPGRLRVRPPKSDFEFLSKTDLLEISEELEQMIHLGHPYQTADLQGQSFERVLAMLAMHYIDTFDHEAS